MSPGVARVHWDPCWRIIPARYGEERVLRKIAEPEDLEQVCAVEEMTNERLRQEQGAAALVAPRDCVSGPGSEYIMAAFTNRSPDGSRFTDGTHAVYYAARSQTTAVEETKFHRALF